MLDLRADRAATTPGQETRIGSENAVLYPLFMDVSGSRCVVVGGGGVASRKARGLLESGARVVVVSPEVSPEIEGMDLTVERRPYRPGDLAGATLAFAATDRREVNAAVAREANEGGIPVNVADRPADGDFALPSVLRRGGLQVAVSTGGASPTLAREIRDALEPSFGAEWAGVVEKLRAARDEGLDVDRGTEEEVVRCLSRLRG
ncbi:MAG: Siroheme synthase / Precorrin-2 oxidase / Sirohydrochlorin ferrochelatase / Uroporphyrinogen-III methyltransferase [uncultured Rubrobacteraceae bacterium]|uniref:precorrin-2 dehydrogenase n=1 Tax=uncultured Rubrobacteraceae bacterium TaxID=349277 RepID=A0A6J4SVT9_9ACTN|nr:MAG: Siroheme synthase / Precorrin-2 oxidase / Sirohydrochlorin ferrochelatase / Uroporphyrinogen-III methyltransferase [uncultured Rubrobacteraceae bacterium]